MELIEEGIAVEKKFRERIQLALSNDISDEVKVESIAIAGSEYFNEKLRLMFRYYEENKEVQKAMAQEKIDKELENIERKKTLEQLLSAKEIKVLNVIAKYKTWATTMVIARETDHTWMTVEKYIQKFIKYRIVEVVKMEPGRIRKKRYQISKEYSNLLCGDNNGVN